MHYNDPTYHPNIYDHDNTIENTLKWHGFPIYYNADSAILNSIQKQTLESKSGLYDSIFHS